MKLILSPELEKLVRKKVHAGPYSSANDVVAEGLRLLQERDRRLKEIRREIQVGLEQADRGDLARVSATDLKNRLRQRLTTRPAVKLG